MAVQITNVSRGLVTVELNSGHTIHLAPRETSPPLDDGEVRDNAWVQRLVQGALVDVEGNAETEGSADTETSTHTKSSAATAEAEDAETDGTGSRTGED